MSEHTPLTEAELTRHSADKVVADLELLRDDALDDGLPTSAMWLTCAIETVNDLAARLADAEARAEAAEAKVARVKELADEWEADDEESLNTFGQHLMGGSVLSCAEHLREALRGDQ